MSGLLVLEEALPAAKDFTEELDVICRNLRRGWTRQRPCEVGVPISRWLKASVILAPVDLGHRFREGLVGWFLRRILLFHNCCYSL